MSQCDKGMLVMELEGMAVKYLEHGGEEQTGRLSAKTSEL